MPGSRQNYAGEQGQAQIFLDRRGFPPPTQPTRGHPINDALRSWHAIKSGEMLNQIMPLEVSWAGMRDWAALPTVEIYQTRADTKYSQVVLK